jgi:flagellar L-ring protein precursor FlgH
LFVSLALVGCATPRTAPDPEYAPVRPLVPAAAAASPGSLYSPERGLRLFEDTRARQVGDILTIVLVEATSASKKAETRTKKDNSIDLVNPTLLGGPFAAHRHGKTYDLGVGIDTAQAFNGSGESQQSNSLSGRITVTVTEVLPNGHLVVRGEKIIALNEGDEYVRLRGIVRPQDIRPDNTVPSTLVADAHISYGSSGALADSNSHGWLSRFFLKWWPF